jgi:hypothetical protein
MTGGFNTYTLAQRRAAQAMSGAEATRRALARQRNPEVFDWDSAIARLKIMLDGLDDRDNGKGF